MKILLTCCFAFILALPGTATPGQNLSSTGDETSQMVTCANLIYAGTRSSVCFSDSFLRNVAEDSTIATARKFKPVKLTDGEVYQFPFAVMTGEGEFSLRENEREQLKNYLLGGGFLLASAGCSNKEWDRAFRGEIAAIFPDLQLKPLPMDHEIFNTLHEIADLKTKGEEAKLEGLEIGGKIVLVYSSDGLNDTSTMHGCCCCGGNEIKNAQQVNANILVYALLQ